MIADRRYSTTKGRAHAAYDGSTWDVSAHPSNGSGQADSLSFVAWRDEAGFRGRQWRVGTIGESALGRDQFATLTEIAEAAIAVAHDRIVLAGVAAAAMAAGQASGLTDAQAWNESVERGQQALDILGGAAERTSEVPCAAAHGSPECSACLHAVHVGTACETPLLDSLGTRYGECDCEILVDPDPEATDEAIAHAEARGLTVVRLDMGGPLADEAWVAIAGPAGDGKAEAGVQQMSRSSWGVWGWNPEPAEGASGTFLDSTYDTGPEAVGAAAEIVAQKAGLPDFVTVEPEWPSLLRWQAETLAEHGFDRFAYDVLAEFVLAVGALAQKDPKAVRTLVEGLRHKGGSRS